METIKNKVLLLALALLLLLSVPMTCLANSINNTALPEVNPEEEAIQLFEQGRELFEMGQTGNSMVFFDKALQKDAKFAAAWLYKAMTAETVADRETSMHKALLLRDNASEDVKILIDIELIYAEDNPDRRFELAHQLLRLQPQNVRALLLLAREHQSRGEISKFRDLASEAIRIDPGSPLGYRALAASWLLNEPVDFSLAGKYMKKFVELRPNEPSAHIALGDVFRATLDLETAKVAYSKAIAVDPQNAVAFSKRGYVNTYLGNFESARADFKKALELTSHKQDYSKPHSNIFSYLFPGSGKVPVMAADMAITKASKSKKLPLSGESDNCYFCCTFISMNHGFYTSPAKPVSSCVSLRYTLEKESGTPDETSMEANFAFVNGFRAIQDQEFEIAKQLIEDYAHTASSGLKPNKNEAHNFLTGLLHFRQKNYEKALASLKKSDTGNICVKYNIGLVYDKLGMFEEAKEIFTQVADFKFANSNNMRMAINAENWLKSYALALEK